MYCILVAGIPASGKSTMAAWLSEQLGIPALSKDRIKELLYDTVGFLSREEKVRLGLASMDIMYYMAEEMMKCGQPVILENNFEHLSRQGLEELLKKYAYRAVTVTLTGDYKKLYERFMERNRKPERHRGHVVNDCYPEKEDTKPALITYENFVDGITMRGMDRFAVEGPCIVVDTTDFDKVDWDGVLQKIKKCFKTTKL